MKRGTLQKMINTVCNLWTDAEENFVGKKEG